MTTDVNSVELVDDDVVENVARAVLFAALVGAFAYVTFPNPLAPGVPVTLQVLGVFLAGIFLGPVWGAVALALYLAAGAIGAPIFSGGSGGLLVLLGPTGGYLFSYPVAAAVVGGIVHDGPELRDPTTVHLVRLVGAMVAGTVVIYAFGVVGYAIVQNVGLDTAFFAAAAAFIPMETVKIAAAVGVVRSVDLAGIDHMTTT